MRAFLVVELDPIANGTACVGQAVEPVTMDSLLLLRSDQPFHHTVSLRTVWRDELLFEPVAPNKFGVGARREDQTIVAAKKERLLNLTEGANA